MLEPYKMVFVNLLASAILLTGLILYKYVYPKRRINLFILLLLISLLPLISVLRKGAYESGDLSYQVKFAMQFFDNLRQGNFIPAWLQTSCSGYGCPGFIFVYLLTYYLTSLIHVLGFSFIDSSKILLSLAFVFSGAGMFLWMKSEFGERSAFAAAIFYLFAPYHLIDLHFRVAIPEITSMAILPFIFLTTKRFVETKRPKFFIFTSVLFALLILSHQVTSAASFPLLLIYGFLVWVRDKKKNISTLIFIIMSYLYGILLTAYYWIPSLMESKYTIWSTAKTITFRPFIEYLYPTSRYGFLFQGNNGQIYTSIGYTQFFVVLMGIYILFKRKLIRKDKIMLSVALTIVSLSFLMMQSFTRPIWETVPIIINFQFAWRLLIQIILFISVIAAIVVKTYTNKTFFVLLCFLTIGYTILNWGNRGILPNVTDSTLKDQMIFAVDVLTPNWVDVHKPWIGTMPIQHIEILSGNAEIREISHFMIKHEYAVYAKEPTQLKENTNYFPGWKVFVNNKEIPINYKSKEYPGLITFYLNKGLYKVDVIFSDTPVRSYSKLISLAAAVVLITYVLFRVYLKNSKSVIPTDRRERRDLIPPN